MAIAAVTSRAATVTWTVTNSDEGHAVVDPANANDGMSSIISQAKTYLNSHTNDTLVLFFPANRYNFYGASVGITISKLNNGNLVLRGDGQTATTLVFNQFDEVGIRIIACNNVTIEEMLLTRSQLYVTQGEVVSVQPGLVRFQLHDGFPDPVWLFNLGNSTNYERTLIGYTHEDPLDPHLDPIYTKVLLTNMVSEGSGVYAATLEQPTETPPWPVGEWVALKCKTGQPTLRFDNCTNCVVQDVMFTNSSQNSLRAAGSNSGMLIQRVTIPRTAPINGRAPCFSSPAGGPQVYSGAAGATIQDCVVVGTADDGIGYFSYDPTVLTSNGIIQRNIVRDNQARGIIIGSSAGGVCQSNILTRNDTQSLLMINLNEVEGVATAAVTNWKVIGNTFVEPGAAPVISLKTQCIISGLHNQIDFVSNTFINASLTNHLITVDNSNEILINSNTIASFSTVNDFPIDSSAYPYVSTGNSLLYVQEGLWVHGGGNVILQNTSRVLNQKVRPTDVVEVFWDQPPIASFIAVPTNGGAPLTVAFTDTSTGSITNRIWNFGDGGTSSAATTNLTHVYNFPGTNTVQLVVSGSLGTSTNIQINLIAATSIDTIGDGIPNWWRAQYFPTVDPTGTTTNFMSCATGDPDGDGFNNLQEYLADLNPTNSASRLAIISIATITNDVRVTWIGGINSWQYLEYSPTLASNQWMSIYTNIPPTPVTNSIPHTGATAASNLFYRIRAHR